ncbi:hypothetical protein CORC01_07950 [Colletotrichum orchidophilum]|uniref:Uncharacterized protein n=1 Tax=Colletotrichum orchidophilum TaxID=1209926 RepID=A0A1G4B5X5_9PEZI|nr:uncharacterized protein CORC01_07950 [Colletotrichum orchidophilum]OHE96804.1 hypothetical protein CORC01_07950 [Colletotrichum orchidophilum]
MGKCLSRLRPAACPVTGVLGAVGACPSCGNEVGGREGTARYGAPTLTALACTFPISDSTEVSTCHLPPATGLGWIPFTPFPIQETSQAGRYLASISQKLTSDHGKYSAFMREMRPVFRCFLSRPFRTHTG